MTKPDLGKPNSLLTRHPEVSKAELITQLKPPPEFDHARFESYRPDKNHESQSIALRLCKEFVYGPKKKLFSRAEKFPGIYLDGGFGVGKTHLLASIWHSYSGVKAYGSFLEYTSLVGYLGFAQTVSELKKYGLICIDEFELDDPGDTMIMSRLLKELEASGTRFAATSNTPPNALGDGRFAASDFQREIRGLGDRFRIVSVDGEDYRHRDIDAESETLGVTALEAWLKEHKNGFADDFGQLLGHLGTLHPTKYRALVTGVGALGITNVSKLDDQVHALRLVAFIDRMYEFQVPLRTSGSTPITAVFSKTMLSGGYRKKYLRTISRMGALTSLS
ncbi:MAG: cell division protein ZapE [Aquiluna sp.]